MKFVTWLKKQEHRDDPIGDLATDTLSCSDRPDFESFSEWSNYLTRRGACREAKIALSDAWKEYQESSR